MKPIKVMQITDLHLRADTTVSVRNQNVAEQVEAVIAAALRHPLWPADLVALTGDIADETEDAAFTQVYQRLAQRLEELAVDLCCIPGNHDHTPLLHQVFQSRGIQTQGVITLGQWRIMLLDSSVPGSEKGNLSDETLSRIDQIIADSGNHHLLALIHHPPIDISCRWLDTMRVANGDLLLERLREHPRAKAIVWGHAHQEYDKTTAGIRLLGTPAACPTQFLPLSDEFAIDQKNSAGFRWCELYEDGSISTRVERVAAP